MDKKPPITIRDLYPHLAPEEIKAVEETFDRYLLAVFKIFQRSEYDEGRDFDGK